MARQITRLPSLTRFNGTSLAVVYAADAGGTLVTIKKRAAHSEFGIRGIVNGSGREPCYCALRFARAMPVKGDNAGDCRRKTPHFYPSV